MFEFQGIWLPDGEAHFPIWMAKNGEIVDGKGTYQIKKLREALKWCRDFRTAIDVGGHVGLFAMQMAKRFELVHAFEPVAQFRECFKKNVPECVDISDGKVILHDVALGAYYTHVNMNIDRADSGGTFVKEERDDGEGIEMGPLDWLTIEHVSFIKIDCEGYEHKVIEGARNTIEKWRPCVMVEQKQHKLGPNFGIKGTPAVDMLLSMGAKERACLSGDYILSWD